MKRRSFLAVSAIAIQGAGTQQTNFGPMDGGAYRPVAKPPKPNAQPSMDAAARDVFEHKLRCVCSCPLDLYTCRTTDFTCPVSPAMHRDVMALVAGGYSADEILDAFVEAYDERVLMAPKREGFNWAGYIVPFAAMAGGAVVVTLLLKRWTRAAAVASAAAHPVSRAAHTDGTPDEMARIADAVRHDEDGEE